MIPRRLLIENLRSHRHTEIDFNFDLAVVTGDNGAGKSTIVRAIDMALFAQPRSTPLAELVTTGEDVWRVEYEFVVAGQAYLVSRQFSKKGGSTLSLQRMGPDDEWIPHDGKTIADTNQRIEQIVGMDRALFMTTVYADQGEAGLFAEATASKRLELLRAMLGLDRFEVLTKGARDEQRGLEADVTAKTGTIEQSESIAATAKEIEGKLSDEREYLLDQDTLLHAFATELDALTTEKQDLTTAQTADEAQRKDLRETSGRLPALVATADEAAEAVTDLEDTMAPKAEKEVALKTAREAETQAAEMEKASQERDRLRGIGENLTAQIQSRKKEHTLTIQSLERSVAHAKTMRDEKVSALEREFAGLQKQTDVLEQVPCGAPVDEATRPSFLAIHDKCPLLAQAREAKTKLPDLSERIGRLKAATPGADDEQKLAELQEQTPAADLERQNTELKAQWKAISYDADAHAKAKAAAAAVPTLVEALAKITPAEAQLPLTRAAHEKAKTELQQVRERVATLKEQLGDQRDWAAELLVYEKKIAEAHAEHKRVRDEISVAQKRQGGLETELAAAQKAAAEVKDLRAEVKVATAEIELLRILGNAHDGAFSRGIPALLIEKILPALEETANELLTTLSNGQMALELRTQKDTGGGKPVAESLEILVSDEKGQRQYETFSGGEQMFVDLALRAALSKVLAQRAGARCETLVLDEPTAPLHASRQMRAVEAIGRLREHFGMILVITHVDAVEHAFPCHIQVSRGPEGSQVEVMAA